MPLTNPPPALLDAGDVLRRLQLGARLSEDDLRTAPAPVPPRLRSPLAGEGPAARERVTAVAAPPSALPMEEVLRRRASTRTYAPEPVPVELVAAVVRAASGFDRAAWPEDEAGAGLDFLVAARHVTGLAPGIYLYVRDDAEFVRLADLPQGEAAADLVLQLEFADAPVTVLACGPLAASLARHGEHGHRLLLARAGAASQAAWLTALDRGLVGSIFAGFLASSLKPLVPVDGYRSAQLLAFSCGHPAGDG